MWLKVSPSERSVAERWVADGGGKERDWGEEREGKREEDRVCVSVCQHIDISSAVLCLSSYLTQVSGEWAAGPVCRDHTYV